jgi:hypothetical protein
MGCKSGSTPTPVGEAAPERAKTLSCWHQYLDGERNARGSFKTSHYGIQFFYRNTLGKDWALFKKRSGFPSRGGCRRRFLMPKWAAFSLRSAIRYTAAVSA